MCTSITHQAKIYGRGKQGEEWIDLKECNVSYDHPYGMPLEHALNIDFVDESKGPGARVAVELSVEAARQLVKTIEAVLDDRIENGIRVYYCSVSKTESRPSPHPKSRAAPLLPEADCRQY